MFRGACAPVPAQGPRLSLPDFGWERRADGEGTKSPLAPPAPAAPSVQGARERAPRCTHLPGRPQSQPPVGFPPSSSSSRARPAFRALNTLFRLRRRRRRQLGPGLPPLPQGPAPGCLRAPGTERNVEPARRPPSRLSAPSLSRDTRVHEYDSTRASPRCVGSPGWQHRRKRQLARKEPPGAAANETGRRNNYRQDQSTPARSSRPTREAAGRRRGTSGRRRPLAGHSTPVPYTHGDGARGGTGGGAAAGWTNPVGRCTARQRAAPMGGRCPSSHRPPVHVFHRTQWPQGRTAGRPAQMKSGLRGKWVDWSHPGTKVQKGKEMEKSQGTRELTNREWAGGRERWSWSPSQLGLKGGTSCFAHLPCLLFHSNGVDPERVLLLYPGRVPGPRISVP